MSGLTPEQVPGAVADVIFEVEDEMEGEDEGGEVTPQLPMPPIAQPSTIKQSTLSL